MFLTISEMQEELKISIITILLSGYIAYIFHFASPAVLNMDPDKVVVSILRIVNIGDLEAIAGSAYYSSIPGFHILGSIISIISGLPAAWTLAVLGSITPSLVAIGAAAYSEYIFPQARIYSAVIAGTFTSVLYFSIAPIPQNLAIYLFIPFILLLHKIVRSRRPILLLIPILATMTISHKLTLFVGTGVLTLFLLMELLSGRGNVTYDLVLVIILSSLLIIQNIWLSEFFRAIIIGTIPSLLFGNLEVPTSVSYTAAVPAQPGILGILVDNGDWIVISAVAGIAWLHIFVTEGIRKTRINAILSASIILGIFTLLSFISGSVAIIRIMFFAGLPFGILISWSVLRLSCKTHSPASLGKAIVVIVLISQLFVTGAVPDHPMEARESLTVQEIQGKQWTNDYVSSTVYADYFYSREIISFSRPNQAYVTGEESGVAKGYSSIGEEFLNKSITKPEYNYILFRTEYEIYQTDGEWFLTYDPSDYLNESNNKIMDNGGVIMFHKGQKSKLPPRSQQSSRSQQAD